MCMLAHTSVFAQSFLVEENPKGWLWDRITSTDLDFDVEVFNQDFFESIALSVEYDYQIESSHKEGFFSRLDKFKVEVDVNPGNTDMIAGLDSPLYLQLKRENEIVFIRQFKKKWDAVKALPYSPLKLPYNAKQAIKRLVPGDFVALPSTMSFVAGAGWEWGVDDVVESNAGLYYLVQGQFLIHIFRLKDNKVRLKLIATAAREGGARAEFKTDLEIFGLSLVDGLIKSITKFDLEFNAGKGSGGQLLLDYIFDLNDTKAAKAYDKILSARNKFKDLSLVRDSIGNHNIENTLQ